MIARLASLLLALPVAVTADSFPTLMRVHDVAPNDVLNIRAEPTAGSDILGTLAHDASDIEIVAAGPEGRWGLLNVGEGAGWVALRYLTPVSAAPWHDASHALRCFGTEPFWSATLDDTGNLTFSTPAESTDAGDIGWRAVSGFGNAQSLGFGADTVTAVVRQASCSDGMSDRRFGLAVTLFHHPDGNAVGYQGCCSLAP